jgi:hypothetical protein
MKGPMILTIEIPKDLEAQLTAEADSRGLSPEAFASQLLRENMPQRAQTQRRPAVRKSLARLFAESPLKGLDIKFD